jgi:hypothetical protein
MSKITLSLLVLASFFACQEFVSAQDYYPYIQGNIGKRFWQQNHPVNSNGEQSYYHHMFYSTDTLINGNVYTTKSGTRFFREDPIAEESYVYSSILEQEFNITIPGEVAIGDTIELTNIVYAFEVFNWLYSEGEITQQAFGRVFSYDENQINFDVAFFDSESPWSWPFGEAQVTLRRGWGIVYHNTWELYATTMVCLMHEGVDLLNGGGMPGCFASTPEELIESPVLYPNPVEELFRVSYSSDKAAQFQIVDAAGTVVKTASSHSDSAIDCSDLSQGIYFVNMFLDEQVYRFKLVKR